MRGEFGDQFCRDGFAIEPLLQHVERLHAAVPHDQKLAVDGAGHMQGFEQIGKAFGNIFAGARIEPRDRLAIALCRDRLYADTVPFPLRHECGRVEALQIGVVERMRQHRRTERCRVAARRLAGAAFEPGEQVAIGRRQTGPQQFDLLCIFAAERGDGGFGEPRRNPDAQAAGDKLDQRPAPGLVECVEPARELLRQLRLAERGQRFDDGGERDFFSCGCGRMSGGPHQRDGLGKIADVIVGQFEQHRIGALGDETADQAGLGMRESSARR